MSARPTGMGMAARGLEALLTPDLAETTPRLDRWFRRINDRVPFDPLRMVLRLALVQFAPLLYPGRRLVFSSHHAPLWRTGRHALIVHDLTALHYDWKKRLQNAYLRRVLPRALRSAELLVTISRCVADDVRAHTPLPITVIPTYAPTLVTTAALPDGPKGNLILVIGAHFSHKNLDLVLAAVRLARTQPGMDLRLVVAGCRRELWWRERGGLAALEAEGWLEVHDYAPREAVRQWMQQAVCLVHPSLAEGQGLPPLEAMTCACPVICADIPVLHETCGDAAFFVDPHDSAGLAALLVALRSGKRRAEVDHQRASAPAVLERFSKPVLRERWKEFFTSWI